MLGVVVAFFVIIYFAFGVSTLSRRMAQNGKHKKIFESGTSPIKLHILYVYKIEWADSIVLKAVAVCNQISEMLCISASVSAPVFTRTIAAQIWRAVTIFAVCNFCIQQFPFVCFRHKWQQQRKQQRKTYQLKNTHRCTHTVTWVVTPAAPLQSVTLFWS